MGVPFFCCFFFLIFYQGRIHICCCCSLLSRVQMFSTPWTAACEASLSFTTSWSLPKFMSIESVMLSNQIHIP